jgi:hypothetical protein
MQVKSDKIDFAEERLTDLNIRFWKKSNQMKKKIMKTTLRPLGYQYKKFMFSVILKWNKMLKE